MAARAAFGRVLAGLYKGKYDQKCRDVFEEDNASLLTFLEKHTTFIDKKGVSRFNHGIAAGTKFIGEAKQWAGLPGVDKQFGVFLEWAGTAMALHALKHSFGQIGFVLDLTVDPLAFLLSISNELQVWNRTRPDDTDTSARFRRVDLLSLDVQDTKVEALIEYVLSSGQDEHGAVEYLTEELSKDQKLMHEFLSPGPLCISIRNRVRGIEEELLPIKIGETVPVAE